ncbi:tetrahydrofolate synthase [Flavobacterium sediminis]|uniref:Dihydrofolate synthase/folylpolyglutamate synthase n=1 Tax=Flavobacterium sediminis TaxID=2201181 RepID=A0A2U8QSP6_9FLAO|nr:folylpolyglutamate synthase/dihydrofolate synthase family protein [Flavobacterium sediminis]AWM13183.1 tetrahydrofolate synthase [Flavobacterium sediminis]
MNYTETTEWLFQQLPMFQSKGATAYKADLKGIHLLCNHLNSPQKYFKSIHIAGTNGKGSTSSMLASIFQEAGFKVGLYTSPHLKDYRERIKINGKKIGKDYVTNFVAENKEFFEQYKPSFFEMTTALAFDYFAHEKVDVAIIEAGLGGRLDSTNHIDPLLAIITNIGMDHKQYLGDTLAQIAYEKAGIIKSRIPVVIGEYTSETKPVFEQRAEEKLAELHYAQDKHFPHYDSDLKGNYQEKNIRTVLTAISILQKYFTIAKQDIVNGLKHVVHNTGLQGRWQELHKKPLVVCDVAHNVDGLRYVIDQIKEQTYKKLHIVLGFVKDKDLNEILPLFPVDAHYYFVCPNIERGLDAEELKLEANKIGLKGEKFNSVAEGYEKALALANEKDMIFVGGSTFVVAEIL